jgi:DNA helicase-2/ATP-dependent DNA helicase PcrA
VHLIPESSEKVICPVCKKPLTYGVYHRVMEIAHWEKEERKNKRIPFKHVIPLKEILSQLLGKGKNTKTVSRLYNDVINCFGSELNALIFADERSLYKNLREDIADAIVGMRDESVDKVYGFDGVYGKITIKEGGKS